MKKRKLFISGTLKAYSDGSQEFKGENLYNYLCDRVQCPMIQSAFLSALCIMGN